MNKVKLTKNRYVGAEEYPFIIAEIGNNHNGDFNLAKKLILSASTLGVDAVKFQKKDIATSFETTQLEKPYSGINSFGKTYREHKEHLEFSISQMTELKKYADEQNIAFSCTPFDVTSLTQLEELNLPFYKISSFHVTDHKLIEAVARTARPIVMSTGMSTLEELDAAMELIGRFHDNIVLLHCVSCYPANDKDLNLRIIITLKERYGCPVGYSGHERGTALCTATIMLGACVIERHFTVDRTMKGPDHALSVEPSGMRLVVNRSRFFFEGLGSTKKIVFPCELETRKKFRGY